MLSYARFLQEVHSNEHRNIAIERGCYQLQIIAYKLYLSSHTYKTNNIRYCRSTSALYFLIFGKLKPSEVDCTMFCHCKRYVDFDQIFELKAWKKSLGYNKEEKIRLKCCTKFARGRCKITEVNIKKLMS